MRTHSEIVRLAGGAEVVAERRCLSVHTVRSWITRDKIPDEWWASFEDEGFATTRELADYSAARRQAA